MQQAVRDALIAFRAATSQAQAEAIKAAQRVSGMPSSVAAAPIGHKPRYTRDSDLIDPVRCMSELYRAVLNRRAAEVAGLSEGSGGRGTAGTTVDRRTDALSAYPPVRYHYRDVA
jgi:hypothetical protein